MRAGCTTTSGSSAAAPSRRWAVPKGVPLEPGRAVLAVHVEDHPLDYAMLPRRDPGGPVRRRHGRDLGQRHVRPGRGEARRPAHLRADGERLRGRWSLVPAHMDGEGAELAPDQAPRRRRGLHRARGVRPDARDARGGGAARRRVAVEVKFDGYRAVAYVRGGECQLAPPTGTTLTDPVPGDCEGHRPGDVRARTRCSTARSARSTPSTGRERPPPRSSRAPASLVDYAFDLLELDGAPLVDEPLEVPARDASEAARRPHPDGQLLRGLPRRECALRGCEGAGARGRDREARSAPPMAGQANARLAEGEDHEK